MDKENSQKIPRNMFGGILKSASLMTLALVGLSTPTDAYQIGLSQLEAKAALGNEAQAQSLIDSLEQNGTVTIAVQKENVGNLEQLRSQILAQSSEQALADDADGIMLSENGKGMQVREMLETQKGNMMYIGDLYIGTPPQRLRAIFDTGSANPWIASNKVTTVEHSFDTKASSTYVEPAEKQWVNIHFGSGEIKGYFANDTVRLGDPNDPDHQLEIPNWKFGLSTIGTAFPNIADAIIGMAYPNFAEPGVTPFFEALRQSGKLNKEVHSWFLSDNPDEPSEIMMGGWNEEKFDTAKLEWHPVVNKLFWAMKLDDVKIGGVSTGICTREGANCTVAPDSGTSMLTMPKKHLTEFDEQYGKSVPCSDEDFLGLPEITYVINGVEYSLPAQKWIRRQLSSKSEKGGYCQSTISDLDTGYQGIEEMYLLGDPFMQFYYTIHDAESDQVGFAPAVHEMDEALQQWNEDEGTLAAVKMVKHISI